MNPAAAVQDRRNPWSIRTKLVVGAGLIAALTILTALGAGYGAFEASRQIGRIEEAQARIEQLAAISTQVSDYAITAVDSATGDFSADLAGERLSHMAATVHDAFERARLTVAGEASDNRRQTEAEAGQAGQFLTSLARMEALFRVMDLNIRAGLSSGSAEELSASLDTFASQFSPLLTAAIAAEQVKRRDSVTRIGSIRNAFIILAVAVIGLTFLILVAINLRVIGPIVSRIGRIGEATKAIGAGDFAIDLPTEPADELGDLFGQTNQMAEALRREKARVDEDRRRLNDVVAERTSELTAANARLSQADAQRRRFFTDVSHELRTPLTVILAEAELSRGAGKEDMEESLGVIFNRARKLNRRVDDMLRVARSESGQIELDLQPTELGALATRAVKDMTPLLHRAGIALTTAIDGRYLVSADKDWIRQVTCGLIENAMKHSPKGADITVRVLSEGAQAVLEISDQGKGLGPAQAEKVFERFRKGQSESVVVGFGIGLSLAKWIVEEHDGSIDLTDAPGGSPETHGGLTVVIRLPLLQD